MTLGEPGLEGQGAEGANGLPISALVSPHFQSSHETCIWGWMTLNRSLTLSGLQCLSPYVKSEGCTG